MSFTITAFELAERYVGMREVPGSKANPAILAMLRLDASWPQDDETPWCSAFMNWIAWHLRLPRSKSLMARSWLEVGVPVPVEFATIGFDVVVLSRGAPPAGHVGFFGGLTAEAVYLLGGNQGNAVSIQPYDRTRILGVRRLWPIGPVVDRA